MADLILNPFPHIPVSPPCCSAATLPSQSSHPPGSLARSPPPSSCSASYIPRKLEAIRKRPASSASRLPIHLPRIQTFTFGFPSCWSRWKVQVAEATAPTARGESPPSSPSQAPHQPVSTHSLVSSVFPSWLDYWHSIKALLFLPSWKQNSTESFKISLNKV